MYDQDNKLQVVNEEISQTPIAPETEQEQPEALESAPEQPQAVEQAPAQIQKRYTQEQQERNFMELRRLQDQKDRELELMRREIEQLRQNAYKPTPKEDDLGIAKDAYAEVQHVEKIVKSALKEQEQRYLRQMDEQRRIEAERTLSLQYKDINQVLTVENLRRLEQEEPEIAASIASNPDTYSAKVAAYKQIKKLGITEDNYNATRVSERLAQNTQRTKSPAAIAPRQGSPALGAAPTPGFAETISDDMAARYRKEMEDAIARM